MNYTKRANQISPMNHTVIETHLYNVNHNQNENQIAFMKKTFITDIDIGLL